MLPEWTQAIGAWKRPGKKWSFADWKAATEAGVRELPEPVAGAQEWQVWSYTPALVPGEPTVDPLSLTLSLQDNADDRIQIALDELQRKIPW